MVGFLGFLRRCADYAATGVGGAIRQANPAVVNDLLKKKLC
jgi:hypothetical protein